jgi:two-component system sensor histidine kinase BarA
VTATDLALADVSRLEDIVDKNALVEVCRSFFDLFSLPIRVFGVDGGLLADVHETRDVCAYVNGYEEGREACARCVGEVKDLVPPPGDVVVHPCFTGAVYRIVPLEYQGRRLGRFVVGPYLPAERREVPRTLLTIADGIDPNRAREALEEMPRVRQETASRIAEHLSRTLDLIVFSGHRALLTTEMHLASVRESYRELAEKRDQLQNAYDRLKELDRLKSNFLATVSHELRTPLTSIIGYSDMLATGLAGDLNGEQQEFAETIRSKGDHLLALISSLLDLNKLEQGRLTVERQPMDATALIREVARDLGPPAAKKGVTVEAEVNGPLPALRADPIRIRQVLFNLGENAVKFSPEGGRVRLSVEPYEEVADDDDGAGLVLLAPARAGLRFSVSDEGPGIPEAEQAKIFDAFYQVDGSSTREHGGTGLGLSIVHRLVVAHGGRVDVESTLGQGSTFHFTIPDEDEA